jgi:uncharacterized protein (DUF342 family)
MPRNEDRVLENLIRGTEELIRDIPAPAAPGTIADPMEARLDEDVRRQEVQTLAGMVEPSADGSVEVTVSKDQMLVHGTFFPPAGDGKPLELEAVQRRIEALAVTFGVDWEAIKGCILTCNEERSRVSDAVIARGMKPANEIPPCLVINENLMPKEKAGDSASSRVDFRELSLFTLVKTGDVLASLTTKQEGAMGTTVRGTAVAFQKEAVSYPKPGRNTQWQTGSVTAACDGRFQSTIAGFWVDEVLDIRGDIDYHVGNVDFPGDVVIQGEIRDGFVVKAGRSLLCLGAIDACQIDCGGDLVTRQGIIGKEKAIVRVGGTTQAKFIEGCSLDSAGSIYVRTSVMNSSVQTRDRLEMGDRGIIIGGKICAQNGVSAAQIGTERGPKTEIHCGIDFKVEQKLIWIRDRNIALAFKLREIENRMKANPSTRSVLSPLRDRIKAAIHQLNENARSLVSNLDRNESADVSIRETVFPGTYIEICHVSYFITKPRRFVTFQLDKASGRIVEKKWEKRPAKPAPVG